MHEYYEKNQKKYKKELEGFIKLIEPELECELGIPCVSIMQESWEYYRTQLLERFPYIGGDTVGGTKNLTGAYCFVALGEVCRAHGMQLERWGYLTTLTYQRYYAKMPGLLKKLMGKMFTSPQIANKKLQKKDAKNAANAIINPGSFETKTQPGTVEYPVIYHNLVCPLANFAKQYGYGEYLPYLCNLDYVMFSYMNVPLYREHTCFADGDYCDFKLKIGAPVMSGWPPVFSQGKGYK